MKKLLIASFIGVLLSSCSMTSYYYQVYKTTPTNTVLKDNLLVYEDDNCKVSYNLWDEGGNIGFRFFNKSDKNIYLDMDESYFILNGVANNYYKNRIYSSSTNSGTSASRGVTATKSNTGFNYLDLLQTNGISASNSVVSVSSSGYSVSYTEEKIICIPSLTSKSITEYNINKTLFRDCDLFKYPKTKQIKTKSLKKADSPLVFSNRIAYKVGQSNELVKFENEFYVSEITNYPEYEMFEKKFDQYCGEKSAIETNYLKNVSADKFYISYPKVEGGMKH